MIKKIIPIFLIFNILIFAEQPYRIGIAFHLGFRAMNESETIEFYLEPALSFIIVNAKDIYSYQGVQTGS